MKELKKGVSFGGFYQKYGILVILILEILFFTVAKDNFLTPSNFFNVGRQISFIGIASIGMTIVMITGGIDISIGSTLALSGVVCAKLTVEGGLPLSVAVAITLLLGIVVGIVNGISTSILCIPALIATLAMQTILKGAAFLLTNALPVKNILNSLKFLGQGRLFGALPVPFVIMMVLFIFGWWFLEKSYLGRCVYAVGGNMEAARLSGINTQFVCIIAYAMCGLFAALAGVLMCGRLGSGQPSIGADFPMDVLTATVLGGVGVNGGKGNIINVLFGAFIMGVLSTGMIMLGLSDYWQWVVKGLVLLLAVSLSNLYKSNTMQK